MHTPQINSLLLLAYTTFSVVRAKGYDTIVPKELITAYSSPERRQDGEVPPAPEVVFLNRQSLGQQLPLLAPVCAEPLAVS